MEKGIFDAIVEEGRVAIELKTSKKTAGPGFLEDDRP